MSAGHLTHRVTLDDVRAAKPRIIFYGAMTCWWTHRREDLYQHRGSGLPCDPRGGLLLEAHDVDQFLGNAENDAAHYGKHGLNAFVAAHHGNVVVSATDFRPTCFRSWDEYNALLDQEGNAS